MLFVIDNNGELVAECRDVESAAREVLGYDGGTFDVSGDSCDGWQLWHKTLNGHWTAVNVFSNRYDEDEACADIFAQVVKNSDWWHDLEVLPAEVYAERQASQDVDE